jgi:hypothetical protein
VPGGGWWMGGGAGGGGGGASGRGGEGGAGRNGEGRGRARRGGRLGACHRPSSPVPPSVQLPAPTGPSPAQPCPIPGDAPLQHAAALARVVPRQLELHAVRERALVRVAPLPGGLGRQRVQAVRAVLLTSGAAGMGASAQGPAVQRLERGSRRRRQLAAVPVRCLPARGPPDWGGGWKKQKPNSAASHILDGHQVAAHSAAPRVVADDLGQVPPPAAPERGRGRGWGWGWGWGWVLAAFK